MRRLPDPRLLLPLLVACVSCGTSGLSGNVFVGPGYANAAVVTLLLERPPDGALRAIAQTTVGTTGEDGGTFSYQFHSLTKGSYLVGAYLDLDGDRNVSPGEPFEWDPNQELPLDPAVETSSRATADVWLAKSAPGTGTITGTVFTSEEARKWPIQLIATTLVEDPDTLQSSYQALKVLDIAPLEEAPFVLNNLPPGDVVLIAIARVGDDDSDLNDLIAVGEPNPVLVSGDVTSTNVALWLDRQAPERGSISGTVSLNAPAVGVVVEVRVLRPASPPAVPEPALVAWKYLAFPPGATATAYTVPSLVIGAYYVIATVHLDTGTKVLQGGTRIWPTLPRATPGEVALTSAIPHAAGVDLSMGVGRASGTVVVKDAPADLKWCEVAVFEAGTTTELFTVPFEGLASSSVEACDGAASCFVSTYELAGLYDADFQLFLRTDRDRDGVLESVDRDLDGLPDGPEDGATRTGSPAQVTVTGGERVGVDFTSVW